MTNTYKALSQLTSVKDWNSNTTSYTYNANGEVKTITYPNAITSSYEAPRDR